MADDPPNTHDPDKPEQDPGQPHDPNDPGPTHPIPGEPDPYPVTDPLPGEPGPPMTPPEPIPEYPPDVKYRVRGSQEPRHSEQRNHRDRDPKNHALKQRPVAEFFQRLT